MVHSAAMPPKLIPRPAIALGYVRASTEEQTITLDAQRQALIDFCAQRKVQIGPIFIDDDVSGSLPLEKRPRGKELCEMLARREANAVVATRVDRLFRNAADCLSTTRAWASDDVSVLIGDVGGGSLDTRSAIGRLLLTVIAGVSEYELGVISERTTAALAHKRKKGDATSKAPFGFKIRREERGDDDAYSYLDPCPVEQRSLAELHRLADDGHSIRTICRLLDEGGFPARDGGRWHATTVVRLLKRRAGAQVNA